MGEFYFYDYADHIIDRAIAASDFALLQFSNGNEQGGIAAIERGNQLILLARSLLQTAIANCEAIAVIAASNRQCSIIAAELCQIAAIQRARASEIRRIK